MIDTNPPSYEKGVFDLQTEIIAISKHQIESLIWSKYASILVNYEGVQASYEELPDFEFEMLKEDYNISSKEEYDKAELYSKAFYNTNEEVYDAFKKLMRDGDIYYFFKNGLYDFEEDITCSRCWKKYLNEKSETLKSRYPANLKLNPDIIRRYLRSINTDNLYLPSKSNIYIDNNQLPHN